MSTITTERLTEILSETQSVINEYNLRGVHGSVEVNAWLFENVLMELLRHRASTLQDIKAINDLLDSDGSRGCFDALDLSKARRELERLLSYKCGQ